MSIQVVDVSLYVREYVLNDVVNIARTFNRCIGGNEVYISKYANKQGYYHVAVFVERHEIDTFINELDKMELKDEDDIVVVM